MNNSHAKGFLRYIGYMQAICIVLVVMGHSLHMYPDGHHGALTLGYRLIYSMHMQAFLFVSGFLFEYTSSKLAGNFAQVLKFLKRRANRLLIPFCVLTVITFVPRALLSGIADDEIPLTWHAFARSFLFEDSLVIVYFWFVQVLFLLSCAMAVLYCWIADRIKLKILTLVFICTCFLGINFFYSDLCSISFLSVGMLFKIGIFFVLGCLCGIFREKLEYQMIYHSSLILIFAALWIASFNALDGYTQYLSCGIWGTLMIMSLSLFLEKHVIMIFEHLVGANYMIFLLSWYFNVAAQQVLSRVVVMPWYYYSIFSVVLGIYIPLLLYKLLCKYNERKLVRYMSFVLGQI